MSTSKSYTSTADVQEQWLNNIATNYFDFDKISTYRAGIFGYINEVMATVTMDTHQAMNIARREFYPVTAQFPQSIHKMASLQKKDLPMVTPGICHAVLLLDESEVLQYSSKSRTSVTKTCVIDSSAQIMADNIPFSLLYPIVILSNPAGDGWTHTVHYDKSNKNPLDKNLTSGYYIPNKVIRQGSKRYLLLSVYLVQVSSETTSQLIANDAMIQTVSLLFPFEGNMAGFEVFYKDNSDVSDSIALTPLMQGRSMIETPFCFYRLVNDNMMELTFPRNIYFTPALNSEIILKVYTSLGKSGEFEEFNGSLDCTMDSERYPYNNNMTLLGKLDGGCVGASDMPSFESYRESVHRAYSTNNVITTSNDLQIKFDEISEVSNNKVMFRKKRMDAFARDYGAYMLLKDKNGNAIPTNTLTTKMKLREFSNYNESTLSTILKPGEIFVYNDSVNSVMYQAKKSNEIKLSDDLSVYDESGDFVYTNPFLIVSSLNPPVVGYYNNSINEVKTVEYNYINDTSSVQFIGSNFKFYRNSIDKENFYKISISLSPTTELPLSDIIEVPSSDDEDYYIRATGNGKVRSITYDEEGRVVCTIDYDADEGEIPESVVIPVSSTINKLDDEDGSYEYTPGYSMNFDVYDKFIEGDILAIKKVTDLGKIRVGLDIEGVLYSNELYIPMTIEEYNKDLNVFTFCGYISTDDIISDNEALLVDHGIMSTYGVEEDTVSIPYKNLKFNIYAFYQHFDENPQHKYSNFDYFNGYTMTNSYVESSEDGVSLISSINYIRSTLLFTEGEDNEIGNEEEYEIIIKEIPMIKADWIKDTNNFSYLINSVMTSYKNLRTTSHDLEDNYGIDMKFYNSYGKSQFFKAGIKNQWETLEQVNCTFKFGVYLSSIVTQEVFLNQFREYVKEKVETINSTQGQQSIYIMNLIHDIKNKFAEIGYIEYYGFDNYGTEVQKVEPYSREELSDELIHNYIPEFINIGHSMVNGVSVPNIEVTFLKTIENQ